MAFRVWCTWCRARISPPFWKQYNSYWCSSECAQAWKEDHNKKVMAKKDFQEIDNEKEE